MNAPTQAQSDAICGIIERDLAKDPKRAAEWARVGTLPAVICAWCGKTLSEGRLPVSHGICPTCLSVVSPECPENLDSTGEGPVLLSSPSPVQLDTSGGA